MLTKKAVLTILQDHSKDIEKYGVKKIGVFGSFARSSQNKRSDIDIIVEFKKGMKTFDNYMDLKFFLEELFQKKIDLVIKDALKPQIKRIVLSDVIYAAL
jgi:hypothetical protein